MLTAGHCVDLETTSQFLGFAPQRLFYLASSSSTLYRTIEIPKRSNPEKLRKIDIPISELKGVQRVISKKIFLGASVNSSVFSYVSGRSVVDAAQKFCPGHAVLKIDIENFFPSIMFGRVYGLFKSLGFNNPVSFMLTRLTTKDGRLTQGAPTSPTISNLILRNLDQQMNALTNAWEMGYLRYSDDLFFYKNKNFNHPRLTELVGKIVEGNGFKVNDSKTRYHAKGVPRITLGLLTHGDTPRMPGRQKRNYRAAFYRASRDVHWAYKNAALLKGMLEWYRCIYGKDDSYYQYKSSIQNINRLHIHDTYVSK
ncbi:MAG: reverse transcriptase family protein [Candidatus Ochrobactrum gambitense]|nr:MAG: reverse transcriptase family protein [Candidatus Ochrobactrum gambitense]WEK16562.1 MAG: reverse transcriptase domain-containing protein [Candidatus Ochrobactrum gambitense]